MRLSTFAVWILWKVPLKHALRKNKLPRPRGRMEQEALFRGRLQTGIRERDELASRKAAINVPTPASLALMRRLENDLAGARGALNVGFVVSVALQRPVNVRVQKDGIASETTTSGEPVEFEANSAVDIGIGEIAQVRIRGGRRDAQDIVHNLEKRWDTEVVPYLAASGATDLDSLSAKLEETQALDAEMKVKDSELESLRRQLALLIESAEKLSDASSRLEASKAALGGVSLASLASDLAAPGNRSERRVAGPQAETRRGA